MVTVFSFSFVDVKSANAGLNGVCSTYHYFCEPPGGDSLTNINYGTEWNWVCPGINGGTSVNCVEFRVNGACGSSNGGNFYSVPTSNLCSSGSASAVTGSGPWSWSCISPNLSGGTNASCSANKMSGTLLASALSCKIPSGGSICSVNLTWSTTNPQGTSAITANGMTSVSGNSGSRSFAVPYNGRTFYLYNNGNLLAQTTVSSSCATNTTWSGSICALNTYTLTVNKAGAGAGVVGGGGTYNYGTTATATATANTGSTFSGWSGDCNSSGQVTMNSSKTCTATFTVNTYPISWTATNGSASPSSCTFGASVTPSCTPNAGYTTATCPSAFICATTNSKTATFTVNTYPISWTATNGSASPSSCTFGATVTPSCTPNAGYTTATCPGAFTCATSNSKTATFTINTYSITASAGAGGSISPVGATTKNYGLSQTYTITPNANYKIASVLVDGSSVGTVASYTFSNITANHTISASFTLNSYSVVATAGSGGTVTAPANRIVTHGSTTSFTFTPNTGYTGSASGCGGTAVSNQSSSFTYTTGAITSNCTVSATFTPPASGTLTPASPSCIIGSGTSNCGIRFSWSVSNPRGTSAVTSSVTDAGAVAPNTLVASGDTGSQYFLVPYSARTFYLYNNGSLLSQATVSSSCASGTNFVSGTCRANLNITASAGSHGSISPSGTTSVVYGSNQTYSITPQSGYNIASVLVDGVSVGAVASYTFSNITANHAISASFAVIVCTNGATNPTACTTCPSGLTMVSGTCTPVAVSVSANTPYNTTPNTNVSFTYTPTTNSGTTECRLLDNTQSSLTTYKANSPITYSSPNGVGAYGYYVQCRNTTTTSAIAISNLITVNTACASGTDFVSGSCRAKPTITVTQTSNGDISPGTTSVVYGSNQTYIITPKSGYNVANVLVDGVSVGAVTSYTFSNITTNHTIKANFAATVCSNGATNPTACNTCTAPLVYNGTSCVSALSVSTPANSTITLPTTAFTASYILTNGTGSNTNCYLLDNNSVVIKTDLTCSSPMSWNTPSAANSYGYYIRATKSSTGETKTSNMFIVTVNPIPTCGNGATNPTACNTCSSGSTMVSGTCRANLNITASPVSHGSISPSGTTSVVYGSNQTYTITPQSGYNIASVLVDGISVGAVASYTFSNITANHAISASFAVIATAPDLTASAPTTTPAAATTNVAQTYSSAISNIGNATATGPITHLFQYDNDINHGSGVTTGTNTTGAISAGGSVTTTLSHIFTSAGTKYMRVCADNNSSFSGTVTESNEGNNCSVWTSVVVTDAVAVFTVPTVSTGSVSGITQTTAIGGGTTVSSGGVDIIRAGLVWSTSANPTYAGGGPGPGQTTDGWASVGESWTSEMTGLMPNTFYHVRSYALNGGPLVINKTIFNIAYAEDGTGIAYGNERTFTTLPASVINGSCAATHYNCISPDASINQVDGVSAWTWTCPGSGPGHTDASCLESKSSCVAYQGNPCISSLNSCGQYNSGAYQCDGSCSAVTPPESSCVEDTCQDPAATNFNGALPCVYPPLPPGDDLGGEIINGSSSGSPLSDPSNPLSIYLGDLVTIIWSAPAGASSCTGTGFDTGGATSGSVEVSPLATTTYIVTCDDPATLAGSLTVTIKKKPIFIED